MKTTKSRITFFAIAITYNLLLGLYLKDFLVLSQILTTFYLLSVLPTFFLLTEARSRTMKAIVYIVLRETASITSLEFHSKPRKPEPFTNR